MTLKCDISFLKCDKCEVKYPWYHPHQYDVQTQRHSGTAIDYIHFPPNPAPSHYSERLYRHKTVFIEMRVVGLSIVVEQ